MARPSRLVRDHWGDRWAAFESRATEHGFGVSLGRPVDARNHLGRGGDRVILTTPLVEYMESTRYDRGTIRLPLGATAIKRLRRVLGHNIYLDLRSWWEGHAEELAGLTETDFASRHGMSVSNVCLAHKALFGRRLRPVGWYRAEPARSRLIGDEPRALVAEDLGISVGAVGRLRWVLRREVGPGGGSPPVG